MTPREQRRRARVVGGWRFEGVTPAMAKKIERYLAGGPVPPGYERMDEFVS